jgi:hypothetical protein
LLQIGISPAQIKAALYSAFQASTAMAPQVVPFLLEKVRCRARHPEATPLLAGSLHWL